MNDQQRQDAGLSREKEICIGLLADDVPRGDKMIYNDRVEIVRQDRDRALYSVYLDAEHQTTIDIEMLPATHRLKRYLDSLTDDENGTDDDLAGWH